MTIDSVIEKVAYSEDGNFLVYGESNCTLHIVFVETQQVIFTKVSKLGIRCISHSQPKENQMVGTVIYCITTNSDLALLLQKIEDAEAHVYGGCFRSMYFTPLDDDNSCDLLVLASSGSLYVFSNIRVLQMAQGNMMTYYL